MTLDKNALFSDAFPFWPELDQGQRQTLIDGSFLSAIPKGTVTHQAQQGCKGLQLVLEGQLRVYIVSEEGREVTLYRVRAGEVCVMSSSCLMDAIVFEVLIEAMADTQVLTIPSPILAPVLQRCPKAELFLYKTASTRFADVMWTMQQILFMGADRREAIFLWEEFRQNGPVIRLTHDEIARCIGSAREVVTRVLNYFAQEGLMALGRGKITLLQPDALQKLC